MSASPVLAPHPAFGGIKFISISANDFEDGVPRRGVAGGICRPAVRHGRADSARHCWQADEGIIAQLANALQRHVAGSLDGPFVVLFQQQGADETDDGVVVGEDADHVGAPLDLAVEALDRIGAVELRPMLLREGHVGEHVGLGIVENSGELWQLRATLIGDGAPLGAGGLGRLLHKGGCDEGRDDATTALAGMRQHVPHEVDAAALPGGGEHLGDGGLQALISIRDDELHPAQASAGELAQELCPDRFGLRGADLYAQHLAPAVVIDTNRDDHRDGDDAPATTDLQVGRINPKVWPIAFDRPFEKGLHLAVDLLAEPRDLALGDAAHAHGLDQIVARARGDALDIGLLG